MGQQIAGAAVDGLLGHDVLTGLCQGLKGIGDGSRAGGHCQTCHTAFQSGNPVLEDTLGGVGQTAVDVAGVCQRETVSGVLAVMEHIRSGGINGNRPGVGSGISLLLTDMQLQSFKFIVRHNHFLISFYF